MDFMTILYAVLVLGALAVIFGLILAVAAKAFEVKVDPRLPQIQDCLAGANCGGCGYPGCGGCAEAILAGKAPITACAPAGAEGAAKIAEIMGMEAPSGEKMVAHVLCNGGVNAKKNFEYRGVKDCLAATKVCGGGVLDCKYGCLGFGSCVAACQFDALHIGENGAAVVDKEKCTNCGACREACPRHLIVEVPYKQKVFVNCSNLDKGPAAAKVCTNSCIGCGLSVPASSTPSMWSTVWPSSTTPSARTAPCALRLAPRVPLSPSPLPRRRRSSRPLRRLPLKRRPLLLRLLPRRRLPKRLRALSKQSFLKRTACGRFFFCLQLVERNGTYVPHS